MEFTNYNNYELKAAIEAAYEDMAQQQKKLPNPYATLRFLKAAEFINEIEDELRRREKENAEKRAAAFSKYQLGAREKAKEENANADTLATHAAMQMHAALQMHNNFDATVQQYQNYVNQLQVDAANAAAMPPMF